VGSDRYAITALRYEWVGVDFVTTFPGGTVHAHGEGKPGVNAVVPIVGGTGLHAGATGSIKGEHLANGEKLNIYRCCRLIKQGIERRPSFPPSRRPAPGHHQRRSVGCYTSRDRERIREDVHRYVVRNFK